GWRAGAAGSTVSVEGQAAVPGAAPFAAPDGQPMVGEHTTDSDAPVLAFAEGRVGQCLTEGVGGDDRIGIAATGGIVADLDPAGATKGSSGVTCRSIQT